MDLDLDETQTLLMDSVRQLLAGKVGLERAQEMERTQIADADLLETLAEAGFLDVGKGLGPLEAALVVEAVAYAGGVAPVGARALVAPALGLEESSKSVALMSEPATRPVRYAGSADVVLIALEDDHVRIVRPKSGDVETVDSPFGFPMAKVLNTEGEILPGGSADLMFRWWRVALALEMVGCMDRAVRMTLEYVKQRQLFGRTLGSYQALQHRLAEAFIAVESAKWLAREAAWSGAPADKASAAAAIAAEAAKLVLDDCHQFHGAIGLTKEYPLHLWTMKLQALRVELGGVRSHQKALAAVTFGP